MFLFSLLFLQSKLFVLNVVALAYLSITVMLNFLTSNGQMKYKFVLYWSIPPVCILINMVLKGIGAQLESPFFYKNEGDFFVSWIIFLVFYLYVSFSKLKSDKLIYYMTAGVLLSVILSVPLNIIEKNHFFLAFFSSHNASSGLVASLLIVLFLYVLTTEKKYYIIGLMLCLLPLFIWSGSRAFFLGLFGALFYISIKMRVIRFSTKGIVFVVALMVAALGVIIFQFDRFQSALSGEDYNTVTRFLYWELAYNLFIQSPYTGIGFGLYNDYASVFFLESDFYQDSTGYLYGGRHAHNIILQLLSELGLVGLLAFAVSAYFLMKKKSKNYKVNIIGAGLFVLLFIASMFGLNFFTPSTSLVFYFFIALRWRPNEKA